jgi:hypothetical protein
MVSYTKRGITPPLPFGIKELWGPSGLSTEVQDKAASIKKEISKDAPVEEGRPLSPT